MRYPSDSYAIRAKNGKISIDLTIRKFKLDIEAVAMMLQQREQITPETLQRYNMAELTIEFIQDLISGAGGKENLDGKAIQKVVKGFEAFLTENAKEWGQAEKLKAERAKSRRINILKAYEMLGKEVAPENLITTSTMMISGVKPNEIEEEKDQITNEISRMIEAQILGRMAGPTGGLVLAKDKKGSETSFYKKNKDKVKFESIKRKPKATTTAS